MGFFDDERLKNFMMFNFYGTDEELSKAAPWILGLTVLLIVVTGLCALIFGLK